MKTSIYITMAIAALAAQVAESCAAEIEVALPQAVTDADYYDDGIVDADKVELGRLLFFDKVRRWARATTR